MGVHYYFSHLIFVNAHTITNSVIMNRAVLNIIIVSIPQSYKAFFIYARKTSTKFLVSLYYYGGNTTRPKRRTRDNLER